MTGTDIRLERRLGRPAPREASTVIPPDRRAEVAGPRGRREGAVVVTLSGVGAAIAVLRHLGSKPLWRDEAISLSVAGRPAARILTVLPHHDANAGLYYLLLHVWLVFGHSPAWARGFSALCFVATAAVAGWAAWRWKGVGAGVAGGLLVALNPFLLYYGQDARPYALAALLALVVMVALFWPAPRVFAVAAVGLIYADAFAVLFVWALAAVALVAARRRAGPLPAALTRALAIVAVTTAPLGAVMLLFERGQISWLPRPSLHVLTTTITSMTAGRDGLLLLVLLALAALAARDRVIPRALVAAAAGPPVVLWMAAQVVPVFIDRYVICSVLALIGLAVAGAAALGERFARRGQLVAVATLVVLALLGAQQIAHLEALPYKVDDGPGVLRYIQARAHAGDAVAYAGGGLRTLIEAATARAPGPFPPDVALAPGGEAFRQHDLYAQEVSGSVLAGRLAAVERLWLITDPGDQRYPQGGPFAALRPLVTTSFGPTATASFGSVEVTLLVRQP